LICSFFRLAKKDSATALSQQFPACSCSAQGDLSGRTVGTFTYVNFVLLRSPLSLRMMDLGLIYFVFLPSVFTTLLAGRAVELFGTRRVIWGAVAGIGLPFLLSPHLADVLAGMVLVGVGTFFAQAAATGFVGQDANQQHSRRDLPREIL
jgi:hypothetical protein